MTRRRVYMATLTAWLCFGLCRFLIESDGATALLGAGMACLLTIAGGLRNDAS
jgi:hypothetical protein